jgi:hypothetical protein
MKLYVIDPNNNKVYLNLEAETRNQLSHYLGSHQFYANNFIFNVNQVWAETTDKTPAGAFVGGLIGVLAGPIGIIAGGILGGIIGNDTTKTEKQKVDIFNNSWVY